MAGRLLVCLSGGLPLLMGLTGWLRWRDKRRAVAAAATAAAQRACG
jgi:uncharacterized iron-regulated membrane protein